MKSVGVVTTSRADYGIYRPVLRAMRHEKAIDLRLFVSGMHLSPSFGMTVDEIEDDAFRIQERIPTLMASDEPQGVANSMGMGLVGFSSAFERWKPDVLIVLGDRFEMYPAAVAALPFRIPVAHIHGGELTLGAIDDALRHSLTKLSHLHFAATEEYARRIRQMGEESWRVHVSGAPSLDNLAGVDLMSDGEFKQEFGFRLPDEFLLVTYHPVTLAHDDTEWQVSQLFDALRNADMPVLFTKSNADTKGQLINRMIEEFVTERASDTLVDHLGTRGYFTAMHRAAAMVGNSSSGLIEAPSFGLPVVNIGERQRGRTRGSNVVDVGHSGSEIRRGLEITLSADFKSTADQGDNPYGDGQAATRIVHAILEAPVRKRLLDKRFTDIARMDELS
jgi:UDP-hydrolysing UDP-N-acetyl-D-glucosamine 2-epimerase